jgi:chromosome segregation ATPase
MFNKLKAMVFVPDAPQAVAQVAAPQVLKTFTPAIEMPIVDSVLDIASIEATITGIIEQDSGFAKYVKFTEAATALEKVIQVEGTRLQAAQATTGLTRDELIESISSHQAVLANEQANFTGSYVAAAEASIQSLTDQTTAISVEIQELTVRLNELSNQRETLTRESLTKTSELAKAKIDFDSVIASITRRFSDASSKLQQYLAA